MHQVVGFLLMSISHTIIDFVYRLVMSGFSIINVSSFLSAHEKYVWLQGFSRHSLHWPFFNFVGISGQFSHSLKYEVSRLNVNVKNMWSS